MEGIKGIHMLPGYYQVALPLLDPSRTRRNLAMPAPRT